MNTETILHALDACDARRAHRRDFLRAAGGVSAAVAGASLLAACGGGDDNDPAPTPTPTPTPTVSPTATPTPATDADVLNFALNLEYLEAQFYSFATTGASLPNDLLTGTGAQGAATGGQQVTFDDPLVGQYAREIAADERAHVAFLRSAIGATVAAQPAIDLGFAATSAFSNAARAAGLITGATASFNPYLNDQNFLLGAFLFEDVGVTAYRGAIGFLTNKTYIDAAAGIHAAEAYHAGLIRSVLYNKGIATPAVIDATEAISKARDDLDGVLDQDQGVRPANDASNIVPTDGTGLTFARAPASVLNILYLNRASVSAGGFFPAGLNSLLKTSAAN
ncbi:ferritin-like domain-containing protein [Sphingomonas sp. CFBP 13720]|uniref:ferritin-like domain-containing protein n=1 Tax=Sphingomonas sp. CFBP 13720 TaxID=2775302 RepID=UPI0017859E5D|nr:ferritin-like domain-containing protein [Sphingomonas sp. CFBP 13720]MBD8679591.1 ferritin-like domain-containing protein [Sphingomonas sp. CFBP 13720]